MTRYRGPRTTATNIYQEFTTVLTLPEGKVRISYCPANSAWYNRQHGENVTMQGYLAAIITAWDLADGVGGTLPVTEYNLARLPESFLLALAEQIDQDVQQRMKRIRQRRVVY